MSVQAKRIMRKRMRFYAGLIDRGDLVFDVGANMGERTELVVALGATVVAVEPQAECAQHLRSRWRGEPRLTLFEGGCAESVGERELFVADAHTLSSMSSAWIETVRGSGRFSDHRWEEKRVVATTTLDALIEEHGAPAFVKIDVEGFEYGVLSGLTQPVSCASIEWARESLAGTFRCVDRLSGLGMSEFNLTLGESMSWKLPAWVGASAVISLLSRTTDEMAWGDLYARTPAPTRP
jgi:FkbM family methyltransferase